MIDAELAGEIVHVTGANSGIGAVSQGVAVYCLLTLSSV